jgi:alpha-tubulin suppressor-like RCC1 family protein
VSGGNAFVSVIAGAEHTCGLLESGLLKCWGLNDVGEVGDGTTTNRSTPVSVSGGHVFLMIAASGLAYHTCGLKAGGVPWCWGWNGVGQLGDGSFLDRVVPKPVHVPVLMGTGAAAPAPSLVGEPPPRHGMEQRSEWRGRQGISRRHRKE